MVKYPGWLGPHEPPRLTAAIFNTRSVTTILPLLGSLLRRRQPSRPMVGAGMVVSRLNRFLWPRAVVGRLHLLHVPLFALLERLPLSQRRPTIRLALLTLRLLCFENCEEVKPWCTSTA